MGGCGLDLSGSGSLPVTGSYEQGNVHSGSRKSRTFLDHLSILSGSEGGQLRGVG
jgi:hypothetical protein